MQREQFGDPKIWDQVSKIPMSSREAREQILSSLDLSSIDHDLIKDAQSYFDNGSFPDRHVAATNSRRKKNGKTKPVYEVRSKVGAAWRGGIVIDDFGDPWLVYAAPHDKFHDTAPSFFADETKYLPVSSDYKLRDKEELTRITQEQDIQYLRQLLEILTKALMDSPAEHLTQLHGQANDVVQVSVSVTPGEPAKTPQKLHESLGEVTIELKIPADNYTLRDRVLGLYVPFIQPDPTLREQVFSKDYENLTVFMTVSHVQLAQLLVVDDTQTISKVHTGKLPVARHFFSKELLPAAYIQCTPLPTLCGLWLVPSRDGQFASDLPICADCEENQPVAQLLINLLREKS
ncbi:DUF3039 domain-containing protein [Glutamicibacter arilaitensis]|uniref:DUF3039 domain-containing protein n=1 Tax=Glutamicibacter arilaitensis TaxID=256701 RepID=UPI003FD1FD82